MKKGFSLLIVAILLVTMVFALGACGNKGGGSKSGAGKDILTISLDGEPLHLDESLTMDYLAIWACTPINDYLVVFDGNLNVQKSLAEVCEQVDDLTFKFKIHEGVKFHNGREVKAEDVKYSIERVADPNVGSELLTYFECIDNVEVTGGYEGLIHLKNPYAPLMGKLTRIPIIPKEAADTNKTKPVGCGPFKFVEWKKDQSIELVKNEDYWREGYPKMDGISFRIIKEYNSIRSAFLAGDLDVLMWANNVDVSLLESTPGVYLHDQDLADAFYVICNGDRKPFDDPRVRKAVALALDKYELLDKGNQGYGVKLDTAIYPTSYYYDDSLAYDQNVEEAKRLLAEAGYPDGFDCKLSIPITPVEGVMGEVIADQLTKVGIRTQPVEIEVSVFMDTVWGRRDYDIQVAGDAGDGDPDSWLSRFCKTSSGNNFGDYSNPKLDELIEKGASVYDDAKRKEIYLEALTITKEEQPITFLFGGNLMTALHDDIQGFTGCPTWRYDLSGVYRVKDSK